VRRCDTKSPWPWTRKPHLDSSVLPLKRKAGKQLSLFLSLSLSFFLHLAGFLLLCLNGVSKDVLIIIILHPDPLTNRSAAHLRFVSSLHSLCVCLSLSSLKSHLDPVAIVIAIHHILVANRVPSNKSPLHVFVFFGPSSFFAAAEPIAYHNRLQ